MKIKPPSIKKNILDERKDKELAIKTPKSKATAYIMRHKWLKKKYNKNSQSKKVPEWIIKIDEKEIQSNPSLLKDKDRRYYSTIKMDGLNLTLAIKNKEFVICSKEARLKDKKNSDNHFIKVAHQINYKEVLNIIKKYFNANTVIMQGEVCGDGIKDNKYEINGLNLFIFNLIIDDKKIPTYEIRKVFEKNKIALMTVPIVTESIKGDCLYTLPDTVEEMLIRAKGDSIYYPTIREGIVVRSEDQDVSFKVINNDLLLKQKD